MMTLGNTNSAFLLSLLIPQRDIVTLFITNEEIQKMKGSLKKCKNIESTTVLSSFIVIETNVEITTTQ